MLPTRDEHWVTQFPSEQKACFGRIPSVVEVPRPRCLGPLRTRHSIPLHHSHITDRFPAIAAANEPTDRKPRRAHLHTEIWIPLGMR